MLWFDILLFEKGTMNSANTVSTVNHQCDRLSLCSNTFSSKHREVKTPSKKPSKPFLSSRCSLNFAWGFAPSVHKATSLSPPLPEVPGCPHLRTAAVGDLCEQAASRPVWFKYQRLFCHTNVYGRNACVHQAARTKEPQAIICIRRLSLT